MVQAMDSSHVSLVSLKLAKENFDHYRCDRSISLGIRLDVLSRMLKCANKGDQLTMKADDDGDELTLVFENEGAWREAFESGAQV